MKKLVATTCCIFFLGNAYGQTNIYPEENYKIERDTVLSTNFELTWIERTIPDSFLEIDYDSESEKYRDIELIFYINGDSVTTIRKEIFESDLDWDYQSIFKLYGVDFVEYDKETKTALVQSMIGKPYTDYIIFVDLYFGTDLSFKYDLRNPERSEEW